MKGHCKNWLKENSNTMIIVGGTLLFIGGSAFLGFKYGEALNNLKWNGLMDHFQKTGWLKCTNPKTGETIDWRKIGLEYNK